MKAKRPKKLSEDELVRELTAFRSMEELLTAKGGYFPSLSQKNAATVRLANLYDKHQEARGDKRRAFRG